MWFFIFQLQLRPDQSHDKNGEHERHIPDEQPQQEERPSVRHGEGSGAGRLHRPADCSRW